MAILHPFKSSLDYESPESHNSRAEVYISQAIEKLDAEKTKDWHFFYSFSFKSKGLESDDKRKFINCEIDFLCLLPNIGVFVFEVKSGKIYHVIDEYEDPHYYSGKNEIGDPYKQAKRNYYALDDILGPIDFDGKERTLKQINSDFLVGFPETKPSTFYDPQKKDYNTFLEGDDLYDFFIKAGKAIQNPDRLTPSLKDVKKIIKALTVKDFTYKYDLGTYIDTVNVRVNMLTEEQRTVLTGLLDNKRCLIYGQAGTGKTVLSEMLFNSFVNSKQKVAYFSYNDFNAKKVEEDLRFNGTLSGSICMPFLRYVVQEYQLLSGEQDLPMIDEVRINFDAMIDYLNTKTDDPNFKKYSVLIIDEAQDIKKGNILGDESNVLLLLDAMLVGGFENGSAYIFFDDAQNINFNMNPFYEDECFGSEGYRYAKFRLTVNCRNTKNIADKINSLEEYESIQSLQNENITVSNYQDIKSMTKAAIIKIRELLNNGVNPSSITILHTANNKKDSPVHDIIKMLEDESLDIRPYSVQNAKETITYTTNRKFKGLESDVVIYLRFENKFKEEITNVDYVTLSRAKGLCYIFNLLGDK